MFVEIEQRTLFMSLTGDFSNRRHSLLELPAVVEHKHRTLDMPFAVHREDFVFGVQEVGTYLVTQSVGIVSGYAELLAELIVFLLLPNMVKSALEASSLTNCGSTIKLF